MATQIPAMDTPPTAQMIQDANASLMYVVTRPEKVFVRGKGSYLWDADDKRYLDFIQGWAVNCLGHSPRPIVRALANQAKELINASPALLNRPMIETAKLLTDNSCMDKVFFASSGAEANEGALKLARKYGAKHRNGAYEVITTWNSFHGRTLSMMAATGKQAWEPLFEPKVPGFTKVNFNDLKAMRKAVNEKTCAIMIEPVQGEGGVYPATQAYMNGLRQLCDETGVLLIFDEIQTGIGRTGTLFAYEDYGVEPDIMTLGKGLGGGFPVSALLAKDKFCVFEAGDQGGTYCAQPLAMVAAQAVLQEMITRKVPAKARNRGRALKRHLKEMAPEFGLTNIRGKGLLVAVDLPQEKGGDVVAAALQAGLLLNAPRPATLRFMPALNIGNAEITEAMQILRGVLKKVLG